MLHIFNKLTCQEVLYQKWFGVGHTPSRDYILSSLDAYLKVGSTMEMLPRKSIDYCDIRI